jgi:hypothetical protein
MHTRVRKGRCDDGSSTRLVAPQHTIDQIAQRAPEILPAGKVVLVDEQDIVFETGVEVRFQSQMHDYGVVVAVDVGVHPVQSFEDLSQKGWKGLWEWDAC